ncbi:hypothetical protein HDF16_002919 [Granulicella aggregans]|uniref:ASPIC/UnbV domain-containing protein n=1 Tax=Granulicella aggregans TaxID=474949 RepID=A0A7W8E5H6_9BACT|nr:CRTAC1 family protein [Granulicella aggregans]MBB5058205.1 hypothetical protein [Granulicella aggregans]
MYLYLGKMKAVPPMTPNRNKTVILSEGAKRRSRRTPSDSPAPIPPEPFSHEPGCPTHGSHLAMGGRIATAITLATTLLSAQSKPTPTITFTNTAPESHLAFTLHSSTSPHRYSIETMTGGVAAFDYDNDGLLDLFFTNGAEIPSLEKSNPAFLNRLFHNNGNGTFTDVTEKAGVGGIGYSMGVAAADFDNDGFTDLYITGVNHNQLLRNNGNGTFTDITAKAGVTGIIPGIGKAWSVTAGWIDYNHDGLLDLFVVNYLNYDLKTAASCSTHKIVTYCSPDDFAGLPNILYRNNGDGTFTDVSKESKIGSYIGKGMGVAFADYDNDGFTDIFVSNDTFPNLLLHNNGDGTFTDQATSAGVAYNQMGKTVAGMGADFRDLDNDGRPDIFHTAMFGDAFPLYRNLGDGQFEDVTSPSGISLSTVKLTGWGTGAFDFDNDGLKDIFTANAAILDNAEIAEHQPYPLPNAIFRNAGRMTFKDVSPTAGPSFKLSAPHRGAAFGDFNNDGRIDIAVTVLNGPAELLMNRTGDDSKNTHNHWIILKLVGVRNSKGGDNHDGLGTQIKITTSKGSQYNEATTATSYNSSSDKRVHFGLGDSTVIDTIELRWPTGIHQTLHNIKPDQILTITEHPDPKP